MNIHSGICFHNGIVHMDKDEWTVDGCTECTCQVSVITPAGMQPLHKPGLKDLAFFSCTSAVKVIIVFLSTPPFIITLILSESSQRFFETINKAA